MFEHLPVVYNSGVFDSEIKLPNKTMTEPRTVTNYEVEYFFADGGKSIVNGTEYPVLKGNVLFAKPGDVRQSVLPFKCKYVHFAFNDKVLSERLSKIKTVVHVSDENAFAQKLDRMGEMFLSSSGSNDLALSSEILSLVGMIEREEDEPDEKSVPSGFVVAAKNYIDRYFPESISLRSLAESVHLSPVYFHTVFKKEMGVTPMKYLLSRRIDAASLMLISTTLPISEISQSCGFSTQSYFSYCFRSEKGCSPASFRKKSNYPDLQNTY